MDAGDDMHTGKDAQAGSDTAAGNPRDARHGPAAKPEEDRASGTAVQSTSSAGRRKRGPYQRILLKVSGEVLMGDKPFGIDMATLDAIAADIARVVRDGVQVCLVIGGGNIFRGLSLAAAGMERAQADYMGMLATVMNALAMQGALEKIGVHTRVQSAIPMDAVCEPYLRRRALRHLEKGRVVIFAAGLGAPFFTTDTPAALRAAEMGCDALFKGTSVDGVYTADPKKDRRAERFDQLSYHDVLARDLKVMDASAISLMRNSAIPIVVFSIRKPGALMDVVAGRGLCTVISDQEAEEAHGGS